MTLDVSVSATGELVPDGWMQIYQNDSLLVSFELATSGYASLIIPYLQVGEYSFKAVYGGDISYQTTESQMISVTVSENVNAVKNIQEPAGRVWLSSDGGISYLNGLKDGDKITIYSLNGKVVKEFTATSESEEIGAEGILLIEIRNRNSAEYLKTNL